MFEHRVDFDRISGLTRYYHIDDEEAEGSCPPILCLRSDVRQWSHNTLGYVPSLETETMVDNQYVSIESFETPDDRSLTIGLYFHEAQDAMMFYIAYAQHWLKNSSFVLRYCPIAG